MNVMPSAISAYSTPIISPAMSVCSRSSRLNIALSLSSRASDGGRAMRGRRREDPGSTKRRRNAFAKDASYRSRLRATFHVAWTGRHPGGTASLAERVGELGFRLGLADLGVFQDHQRRRPVVP